MSPRWCLAVFALFVFAGVQSTSAASIEAVRGKSYALSERHGPWMIMVASFRDVPPDRREPGLSAEDAALELVYELRKKGIPAYSYGQKGVIGRIDTVDRLGREDERIYAAQRDMISVIAGNYQSYDDETAQKTLAWIKSFVPEFMTKEDSGGIYRQTPGRKGPLGGAFMTINPLLKPEDIVRQKPSPEIARWNSGSAFPLLGCKRAYSLQVATFSGRQATPLAGSKYNGKEDLFDREIRNAASYGLNRAGEDAEHLAAELRKRGVEAYVHHDRYQSIVTVGGFDNPNDPAIRVLAQNYAPRYKQHPETGQETLMPESLVVPHPTDPQGIPNVWVFDLSPQVIAVPRAR